MDIPKEVIEVLEKHDFQIKHQGDKVYIEKLHFTSAGQLSLFPLNAKVGKKYPAWKRLGFDQQPTFLNH